MVDAGRTAYPGCAGSPMVFLNRQAVIELLAAPRQFFRCSCAFYSVKVGLADWQRFYRHLRRQALDVGAVDFAGH